MPNPIINRRLTGSRPNGLLNNLIHFYQLQESAASFADSGSGNTALSWVNFGADFSRGTGHVQAFASAYSGTGGFNGISTISAAPFDFSGDGTGNISMTYCCWFNCNSSQPLSFPVIFAIWGSSASTECYVLRRGSGANLIDWIGMQTSLTAVGFSSISASDNAWHLFVGGFDKPNSVWWYQLDNGARQTTTMASQQSVNSTAFDIFQWAAGGKELHGLVSDVGIWKNRVLTVTDVSNLWNGGAGLSFSKFTT